MKNHCRTKAYQNSWSDPEKLSLAADSLSALSLLSFGTQAGIIYTTTSFTITPSSGISTWSVDNSGRATFKLKRGIARPSVYLNSNTVAFARGMVQKNSQINSLFQNLPLNLVIGPTMTGYKIGPINQPFRLWDNAFWDT